VTAARVTLEVTVERRTVCLASGRRVVVYDARYGDVRVDGAPTKAFAIEAMHANMVALACEPAPSPKVYFAADGGVFVLALTGPGQWGYMIQRPDSRYPSWCMMPGDRSAVLAAMLAHLAQYNEPAPAAAPEVAA
jgi:hypothetical protein